MRSTEATASRTQSSGGTPGKSSAPRFLAFSYEGANRESSSSAPSPEMSGSR